MSDVFGFSGWDGTCDSCLCAMRAHFMEGEVVTCTTCEKTCPKRAAPYHFARKVEPDSAPGPAPGEGG